MATFDSPQTEKLAKQPLVLVLAQVRFSPIDWSSSNYLPTVQEGLRKQGFPVREAGFAQGIQIQPDGLIRQLQTRSWVFHTRNQLSSIIVEEEQIVFQACEYERFETDFLPKFSNVLDLAFKATKHDTLGTLQRIGLRYVDLVSDGEVPYRRLLNPSFHGVECPMFEKDSSACGVEMTGKVILPNSAETTFRTRTMQNKLGFDLPPDLVGKAPKGRVSKAKNGKVATLLDMDIFWEAAQKGVQPSVDLAWIEETLTAMHTVQSTFFREVAVTKEALSIWK